MKTDQSSPKISFLVFAVKCRDKGEALCHGLFIKFTC